MRTSDLKHVVISRTDGIGDAVLTLPVAGALKQLVPGVRITFLGRTYTRAVADACAHVDAFANWDDAASLSPAAQADFLRALKADAFIHAFPRKEVVIAAKAAAIPVTVGTVRRWYSLLRVTHRTWFSRKNSMLHEAALNLKLLEPLKLHPSLNPLVFGGWMGLRTPNALTPEARNFLVHPKTLLLHPLSHGSAVEWPVERFADLASRMTDAGWSVGITATAAERERLGDRLPWERVTDFGGKLTLEQLMALIGNSTALVAGSTGPLHLAAALGIHAVGLYAPVRPIFATRWMPIGTHAHFIEANELPVNGVLDISVDQVVDLLNEKVR